MNVKKLKDLRYLAKYYPEKLVMRSNKITKRLGSRRSRAEMVGVNANWVYSREHGDW